MKPTVTPKAKRKVRLRFKAKDLKRVDLEELRRRLEATQQPEIETAPEPVEEEPVVVVPPESLEVPEDVELEPLPEPKESWKWPDLPWKGVAIGTTSIAVFALLVWGIYSLLENFGTQQAAEKAKESKPEPSKPSKEPVQVEPRDWPDVPDTDLDSKWLEFGARNDPETQFLLGSHLAGELDKDPKPAVRVFENFNHSVKGDHPRIVPAMRNLAWCYEYGVGTEVDEVEAEKWEARADEAGLSLVDGTTGDSRMVRALASGLVLLGWLGFLAAARGIWRRRLASMPEASREQARAVVFIDSVSFARRFLDRFGTMLLPAFFVGLAWLMHHVEASALLAFFIAMVIGLPASVLLLYIATRLRREPFPELNYFRGRNMSEQHSGSAQFNLIVRKLPLLFVLSLLIAQFVGLAWGVLLSIGLVGVMCSREIDVLPQLDIWPGPGCGVVDSQKTNWFIRRLPLHVVYLAVYFAMGWCALLAFVLFAEFVCMALGKQIRRHFVIIGEREPPRLTENTAGMISRRMRFSPNMLSFWWAFWAFMLVCASFAGSPSEAPVGVTPGMLGMLALLWGCLKTSVSRMRDNDAVFQSLPWTMFVSWVIGMGAAVVVGVGEGTPVIGFVVAFGIALVVGQQLLGGSAKPPGGNFLKRQLSLSLDNESWLMGWWRIKSPHLLFTAGCIGMLLALGPQMFSGENLRQLVIGILGIGLLVIAALGFVLLKFDVKLLPEKQLPSDARSRDSAAKRDIWGVLTENAFLVFAGSMALAWLVNPVRDVGGFEHYWARALFMGLPVMLAATWLGISVRHRETASTLPKPWIQPTAEGVNVRWRMFLGAAVLVAVLLVSVGTWVYGEKRTTPDVIELSGNSYILLESGFLLPTDSLP